MYHLVIVYYVFKKTGETIQRSFFND